MRTVSKFAAIAVALTYSVGHAQMNALSEFQGGGLEGFHLYSVNVFSSYISSAYPVTTNLNLTPGATQVGADWSYGAGLSAGMRFSRGDKGSFSLLYTGSYSESRNYNTSGFNHSLRMSAAWNLTPKWTLDISGTGQYQTLIEYLFEPSSSSIIAQSSNSFNGLSASNSVGPTDASTAGSLTGTALGGAAPLQSPALGLLVGARVLAYTGQVSMTYVASPRLSFHLGGLTAAGETSFGNASNISQPSYKIPHTIGLDGGATLSYEISSRTTFGVQVNETRNSNRYQDAYASQGSVSLGRKMGNNWFLRGSAGVGYTLVAQQAYGVPQTRQFIGSGSIGYKLQSHTFLASYNRSSTGASALAVGTSALFSGAWSWRRPGSNWGVFASVGEQKLSNTGYANFSGWTVSGGSTVHLVGNILLSAQYVYSNDQGTYLGNQTKLSVNSARVSIAWAPGWDRAMSYAAGAATQH
jgi:hypothetical protein